MDNSRQNEIDQNFDFFQRNLGELLAKRRGQFALLKARKIIGFFPGPGEAYRAGLAQFPDELFSLQEVEDRPAEMGMMSLALD